MIDPHDPYDNPEAFSGNMSLAQSTASYSEATKLKNEVHLRREGKIYRLHVLRKFRLVCYISHFGFKLIAAMGIQKHQAITVERLVEGGAVRRLTTK